MAQQRIYHWKHGWIPLDHYAAIEKDSGRESTAKLQTAPDSAALVQAAKGSEIGKGQQKIKLPPDVKSVQAGSWRLTTVNGYPDVVFQEVVELPPRPPQQYREVARDATKVLERYPRAEREPLVIGFSNELHPAVMADTNNVKPHKIRVNTSMWEDPHGIARAMANMRQNHFGLTAEADSLEQFRANVLTHEIGHVLHMRDLDELSDVPMHLAGNSEWGAIEGFTQEQVTPRSLGYTSSVAGDIDTPHDRAGVDSLGGRSAYALTNNHEFFAEAFLDGTVNGDQASESGKRAVQIAGRQFGPGSPSVRDRLYGKEATS